MKLLISYFGKNKGTTDFYVEYLLDKKIDFYWVKLPLDQSSNSAKLLKYASGKQEEIDQKNIPANFILGQIVCMKFILSSILRIKQFVTSILGFGSITLFPVCLIKKIYLKNIKTVFYGVDFSKQRFGNNKILNYIYLLVEKIAIKGADLSISVTKRAEDERIKLGLKKEHSLVIPNGINPNLFVESKKPQKSTSPKLIFWGTLSIQSGIVDFLRLLIKTKLSIPIVIVGRGDLENEVADLVNSSRGQIQYLGSMDLMQIKSYLTKESSYIGVAPYSASDNDHVFYGDSLKIKEYVALGLPYIASTDCYIDRDFKQFGLVYSNSDQIKNILSTKLEFLLSAFYQISNQTRLEIVQKYSWAKLFSELDHRSGQ